MSNHTKYFLLQQTTTHNVFDWKPNCAGMLSVPMSFLMSPWYEQTPQAQRVLESFEGGDLAGEVGDPGWGIKKHMFVVGSFEHYVFGVRV